MNNSDTQAYAGILQSLKHYFDGLYEGDVNKMKQAFHPQCMLHALQDGELKSMDMETYYASVAARPSPQSAGDPYSGEVVSVSLAHGNTASVIARTARLPRIYTDYLHLVKTGQGWQIIGKTYAWDQRLG